MTKERLEELIKQEAEIYVVADNHISKYKLEKELRPFIGCNRLWVDVFNIPYDYQINQIFETEADAEKELERQIWKEKVTAERIERFEPPMWDDIEDRYEFDFTNDCGDYKFNVIKSCMIEIIIHRKANEPTYFEWLFEVCDDECTKENYEKACEIVRGLFSGNNG